MDAVDSTSSARGLGAERIFLEGIIYIVKGGESMSKNLKIVAVVVAFGFAALVVARPIVASAATITWGQLKCLYHPTQCKSNPPPQAPVDDKDQG